MAQTSFKDAFTLTKDQSLISLNVTSGEQCFWPVKHTSMYPVLGTTQKFMIGGNPLDLIQLDFTKSTDPGVTSGSIREDYINTIHDLIRYDDVITINGIVSGNLTVDLGNITDLDVDTITANLVCVNGNLQTDLIQPKTGNIISVGASLLPTGNIMFDLGSSSNRWKNIYANEILISNIAGNENRINTASASFLHGLS